MPVFQPQIVGQGGSTYTAGKGINIDENNEISVVDPVLVNESQEEGVVQIGEYELMSSDGIIPGDRLADKTGAQTGQVLTLDNNLNPVWSNAGSTIQVEELPEATSHNFGQILQYVGETIPEVPESVIIEQTEGTTFLSATIDKETFISMEHPEDGDIVDFIAYRRLGPGNYKTRTGEVYITEEGDIEGLFAAHELEYGTSYRSGYIAFEDESNCYFTTKVVASVTPWFYTTVSELESYGFVIDGTAASGNQIRFTHSYVSGWKKENVEVDVYNYGITYSGTPVDGTVLEVTYAAKKQGYTNGYFYKNEATYSKPTATVSQTEGSGLTNLSVDVNTFINKEHPTGDETVSFVARITEEQIYPIQFEFGEATVVVNQGVFLNKAKSESSSQWYWFVPNIHIILSYDGDSSEWGFQLLDSNDSELFHVYGITEINDWGISIISGTLPSTGYYEQRIEYEHGGSVFWSLVETGEAVDITEYGISYEGNIVTHDVLTIVYTESKLIDYNWNPIDVQQSSGSSSSNIDWKTKIDLPQNYYGDVWCATPYYTIAGGLPNGQYEFYLETKIRTISAYSPVGALLFKFAIKVDGNYIIGNLSPVLNGDYTSSDRVKDLLYGRQYDYVFYRRGSDLILFYSGYPFSSDALAEMSPRKTISECFKLSAIKNIDTGEEYVAVGEINLDGSGPSYDSNVNSYLNINPFISEPERPVYHTSATIYGQENGFPLLYINFDNSSNLISNVYSASYSSEVDIYLTSDSGGKWHCIVENSFNSYEARILEASGDLKNAKFVKIASNNVPVIELNRPNESIGNVYASIGTKGSSVTLSSCWGLYADLETVDMTMFSVGSTVTGENFGTILQYTGETNASYTNGYFYKASGTPVLVPESITMIQNNYSNITISVDTGAFITAVANYMGWSEDDIRGNLRNPWQYWIISCNAPSGEITGIYWENCGSWLNKPNILACFTITGADEYSGILNIYPTMTYTPEHYDVQNGYWAQVNVQPGGGGGGGSTSVFLRTWEPNE